MRPPLISARPRAVPIQSRPRASRTISLTESSGRPSRVVNLCSRPFFELREPGVGADPQPAVPVAPERRDGRVGEGRAPDGHRGTVLPADQAALVGADPEGAVGFEEQGPQAGRAAGELDGGESPVVVAQEAAAVGGDPEAAVAIGEERVDGSAAQRGGIAFHKQGEADAVETGEAPLRAHPEIAVGGLGDDLDRILGQALLDAPGIVAVLAEGMGRVEGERRLPAQARRDQRRPQDLSDPSPPHHSSPNLGRLPPARSCVKFRIVVKKAMVLARFDRTQKLMARLNAGFSDEEVAREVAEARKEVRALRMTRKDKAHRILEILDGLYPTVDIPLDHVDPFTLLVAVVLSAQTTDKLVNEVTPALFARASTPERHGGAAGRGDPAPDPADRPRPRPRRRT